MSDIKFREEPEPPTPEANKAVWYLDSADGKMKLKKDDGSVTIVEGAGGGGGVTDHGALTGLADDDHTQYQLRTEKNAASGYAGLDASSKLTGSQQVYGSASNTACVGNDARLSDARTPLAHTHTLADVTDDGALAALNTVGTSQIDNDSVTYAKIQNVSATDRLLGRSTAGAGDVEEITCTAAGRAILDDATAADQRTTLGAAATSHTHSLADITDDGALAALNTVGTSQIDNDSVTYAKLQNVTDARLLGRSAGSSGDCQEITVGSGLSLSGGSLSATGGGGGEANTGSNVGAGGVGVFDGKVGVDLQFRNVNVVDTGRLTVALDDPNNEVDLDIPTNAIDNTRLRDSAGFSVIGKASTGTGDPADITAADETVLGRTGGGNVAFAQVATGQIANDAVTLAKLANIGTDRLLGRDTAATGDPEELTVGGGIEFTGSGGIQRSALTGDVTASAGNNATTIANNAVSYAKLQDVAGFSVVGKATTGSGDAADITAADGQVLGRTGGGNVAFGAVQTDQIAGDAVTFAKLQNIATDRLIGRDTAAAGDPEELTVGNGLEFTGSGGIGIANDGVTYARIQNVTDARLLGRSAGSSGDCQEITVGSGLSLSGGSLTATGGGGGPSQVKLSSDQTVQSTTPEDVTGLSFSLSASTDYGFEFVIMWQSDTSTVGAGFAVNGPTSPTDIIYSVQIASSGTASIFNNCRAYDSFPATTLSVDTINANMICIIKGIIRVAGSSGTLIVRHRLETGSSAINTVKTGSYGLLYTL